jgi:hypothetical protein
MIMTPNISCELLLSVADRLQRAAQLAESVQWVLDFQASEATMSDRASSARAIGETIVELVRSCCDDLEPMEMKCALAAKSNDSTGA